MIRGCPYVAGFIRTRRCARTGNDLPLNELPLSQPPPALQPIGNRLGRLTRFRLARYSLAIAAVAVALVLRLAMEPLLDTEAPYLLMFTAVIAASAYGGLGPGLLATALVGIASYLLFLPEPNRVTPAFLLFVIEGGLVSVLGARLHQAIRHAEITEMQNLNLEQRILEISDDERRSIGHDLHDGLGQQLTGIALLSKVLQQRLARSDPMEAKTADRIATLVNQSIAWTRDLARGLSPVTLKSGGFSAAMEEAAINSARVLGIDCTFSYEGEEVTVDGHTSLHLYRIIQEAMSNSAKHGKAKNVTVRLHVASGVVHLTLADDGIGISAKTLSHPGLGLQIMRHRARMIGADVRIASARPEGGAVVECIMPLTLAPARDSE